MGTISIGGRTYTGNNISIINNRIYIDGVLQTDGGTGEATKLQGVVEVRVLEGIIHELKCDASVTCGPVTGNVTADGSVSCDDVGGSVKAGGSVSCDDVTGSVTAGGSVSCDKVGGSVTAGGSVRHG